MVVNVSFHLAPAVRGGDRTSLRFSLATPYDEAGRALAMQSQGMDFVVSAAHLGDPAGGSANGLTKPRITSVATPQDGKFVLNWPSTTAAVYSVDWATNLNDGFHPLQSGIQATPPNNSFTDSVNDAGSVFYRIRTE